jgi:hypothetical protein
MGVGNSSIAARSICYLKSIVACKGKITDAPKFGGRLGTYPIPSIARVSANVSITHSTRVPLHGARTNVER